MLKKRSHIVCHCLHLQVAAVSTIVNRGTPLKAYVFRNYNLLPGVRSPYLGGCQHQLWQAIRATSAAPGYFQEFTLGNDLHQVSPTLSSNRAVERVAALMMIKSVLVTEEGK